MYGIIAAEWVNPQPIFMEADMTAIAIIYTAPEGFIVAADGRVIHSITFDVKSDEVQKVFEVKCPECKLAYVVTGDILGDKEDPHENYDLLGVIAQQTEELCAENIAGFDDYCRRLGQALKAEIIRANESCQLAPPKTQTNNSGIVAQIHLVGYYKGRPQWRHFVCERSEAYGIEVNSSPLSLPNGQRFIMGSSLVPQRCLERDQRLAKYRFFLDQTLTYITLPGAADYAKAFIDCCSDPVAVKIDPHCRIIGGHLHMLEITSAKFHWRFPPKQKRNCEIV